MISALAASAAVLLAVAGLAKLWAPGPAVTMLIGSWRGLRPHRRILVPLVRVAAAGEVGTAVAVVGWGGRVPAALLGLAYLVFAAVAVRLVRAGGSTSCGCFGRADSPVGTAHVVLNVCCAAVAGIAVALPAGHLAGLAGRSGAVTVTGAVQIVLLAWLAYLAVTALPALATERRRLEAS